MAILKDLAQVLRVHELTNTSLVVALLGRRLGQFRVHIKGGRRWPKKGFEGGFDLLARGEILVYPRHGDALWVFKEWEERARPALGHSVAMLRAASFLCELAEALTRHTAGSRRDEFAGGARGARLDEAASGAALYDLLAATADALAHGAQPGPLLMIFALRALQSEGLLPELHVCTACRAEILKTWQERKRSPAARTPGPSAAATTPRRKPQAVWVTGAGLRCQTCVAAAKARGEFNARGVWLAPEAYRVLLHLHTAARPVKASATAGQQLGQALIVLVHGVLERDLRTLRGAARLVAGMGGG